MELAMAPRVLPSLSQSRPLLPKRIPATSLPLRVKPGLVRSSSGSGSGSDFWSRVAAREEAARLATAEKEDEAPVEKGEEVKREVSPVVEELKEEASVDAQVKEEGISLSEEVSEEKSSASVDAEVKEEGISFSEEVSEEKSSASVDAEVKEEGISFSEEVSEEKSSATDPLNQLNLNLDSVDKSKLVVYGAGALLVLWISSIVVSAVDSIPLFPKLMEVVGLGYTVWFSSRYLLFKENREELFTKISELKDQVLGSDDEQ